MKKSGAPEVGDLIRCRWPGNKGDPSESSYEVIALVVGERSIWVRILPLSGTIPKQHRHMFFSVIEPERWVARTECEIIGS